MSPAARVAALAVLTLLGPASAAEHPFRGLRFALRQHVAGPHDGQHSLRVRARDDTTGAALVGNPAATGASLTLVAAGDQRRAQTLTLAAVPGKPGWRRTRKGLVYEDQRGDLGPVRLLRLERRNDALQLDVRIAGPALTLPVPVNGAAGGLILTIRGGDTYCTGFGDGMGGSVRGKRATRLRIAQATRAGCPPLPSPPPAFTTFESEPVRPLALSPDGTRLFAVNTPDARLEIFAVAPSGMLTPTASVPVGLEPVAVAARTDGEVWVVNHLSDSLSVVDVAATPPRVVRTIATCDEPRDLVFAGPGQSRAFVTTARRGQRCPLDARLTTPGTPRALVQVFDTSGGPAGTVELFGDTPRALAVSPDGATVYAGVFRSGNRTTTVHEGLVCDGGSFAGACLIAGGVAPGGLPFPNPISCDGRTQPETGLVVQHDAERATWVDDVGRNWNDAVRLDLPDLDVFSIDASASPPVERGPRWAGVGTVLFGMAVDPLSSALYVANTEANNLTRFEGDRSDACATTSVRGHLHEARVTLLDGDGVRARHLNPHLADYAGTPSPADRARSLATPIALATDGTTLWVAAYGSSAVGVVDVAALAAGTHEPAKIAVTGGGPGGLVLRGERLFVATRFDDGISVVDTAAGREIAHLTLHNPEPAAVVEGRPFLYDADRTSANGEASCAACHVFGDLDGLAWDLGDPRGDALQNPNPFEFLNGNDLTLFPMKGPMTTQSLRGLAGNGPMHWRGDRTGGATGGDALDEAAAFDAFNPAFVGLLGRETSLGDAEMDAFTAFALQLAYPPNPIRALDSTLTPAEARGERIYFDMVSDGVRTCDGCHVLDPPNGRFGTDGDSAFDGEPQLFKIPHLRNAYQKVGMFGMAEVASQRPGANGHAGPQVRGFGFLHDGSIDTLFRFLTGRVFNLSVAQVEDVEAFVLGFDTGLAPIVGQQATLDAGGGATADVDLLFARAARATPECEVVVKGVVDGAPRGWVRLPTGELQSDRAGEPLTDDATVRALAAAPGQALTYTCVPLGSGRRMGVDRDGDDCLDGDDPAAGDPATGCAR